MTTVAGALGMDEAGRLAALEQIQILDTEREDTFDAIAHIAAALFRTPIATVTFVDERRQWFKAAVGLELRETPREIAFCNHTIATPDVFVVPDAHSDPRFCMNPLVVGAPRLRFYAGAPLVLTSGARVGSLAIMDYVPRELDGVGREHLARLAGVVVDALEQRMQIDRAQRAQAVTDRGASPASTRYRAILDAALDAIVMADAEERVVELNPAAERLLGHSRRAAIGRKVSELMVPPAFRARHQAAWARYAATGEAHTLGKRLELTALHASGRELPIELVIVRLPEEPPMLAAFIRDLTAERQLRQQLLRAQKMEAVGRLAGGLAHDFNNNIGVIAAYAGLLVEEDPPPLHESVAEIRKAVARASELTRQLLAFSKQRGGAPVAFDVDSVLRDLGKMLERVIGKDLSLVWQLGGPPEIFADRSNVEQAIMNLVINARDAMPRGGVLTIETGATAVDGDEAKGDVGARPGRWVRIAVGDTGTGMDAATQSQLFEPFFTTKEQGTGLGLAMVFGVVTQTGGTVRVRSAPGAGSTFELYFPSAEGRSDTA